MFKLIQNCLILSAVCGLALTSQGDEASIQCVKSASFLAPPEAAGQLNYAPDREVSVLHFALVVTPDFHQRTVAGRATWQFKPNVKPVRELKLDAVGLTVESVTATDKIQCVSGHSGSFDYYLCRADTGRPGGERNHNLSRGTRLGTLFSHARNGLQGRRHPLFFARRGKWRRDIGIRASIRPMRNSHRKLPAWCRRV